MTSILSTYKLYGYDNLFLEFDNLLNNNLLPNKILLSGANGIGKYTFAVHFINYVLSKNEDDSYSFKSKQININNKSFKLMNNSTHPNFSLINLKINKKNIEIDQIRNIINYSQKSSFNQNKRFILIDNIELLTKNASNSLLKLLEEPPENLYFILIHDNSYRILETIKSRSINFKINFTNKSIIQITKKIIGEEDFSNINNTYLKMYNSIGDLVFLNNFAKKYEINIKSYTVKELLNYIISKKLYKKDSELNIFIYRLIQLLLFETFYLSKDNKIYDLYKYFILKMNNTIKYNLDIESLFFEFKNTLINE